MYTYILHFLSARAKGLKAQAHIDTRLVWKNGIPRGDGEVKGLGIRTRSRIVILPAQERQFA